MRLISECPTCHKKNIAERSHKNIGKSRFITLECGHIKIEKLLGVGDHESLTLKDGRKLYPFQVAGENFIERSNFRCQISDEMGLGKTIQAIAAIDLHYDELSPILVVCKASLTYNWLKEITSGTKRLAQVFESGDSILPMAGITIVSFDTLTPRTMKIKGSDKTKTNRKNLETLIARKFKTVILDEVQAIKNHTSKRTNAVRELIRAKFKIEPIISSTPNNLKHIETLALDLMKYHGIADRFKLSFQDIGFDKPGLTLCRSDHEGIIRGEIIINTFHAKNQSESEVLETIVHEIAHAITPGAGHRGIWKDTCRAIGGNGEAIAHCEGTLEWIKEEPSIKGIIGLSGTPIKNNAVEYFPILNILRPEMFPSMEYFTKTYVNWYRSGWSLKAGGLRDPEEFLEKTKDFIIRRTRNEVLPDLPKVIRDYKYYPLGEITKKAYSKHVKELSELMEGERNSNFQVDLLAQLSILRHITGLAKIEPMLEFIDDFMDSERDNPEAKLTVFHHHIDVGDIFEVKLKEREIPYLRITSEDDSEIRISKIEEFKNNESLKILFIPTLAGGEGLNIQFCDRAVIMEREWNPANEEQAEGRFSRIGASFSSVSVTYPIAIGTIDEWFAELVEQKREIVGKTLDGAAIPWNQSSLMIELADKIITKWRM